MSSLIIVNLIELSRVYEDISRSEVESSFLKIFYHTPYALQDEIDLCNLVFDYFDDPDFSEEHYIDEVYEFLDNFIDIINNPSIHRKDYMQKISHYLNDLICGSDEGYCSE